MKSFPVSLCGLLSRILIAEFACRGIRVIIRKRRGLIAGKGGRISMDGGGIFAAVWAESVEAALADGEDLGVGGEGAEEAEGGGGHTEVVPGVDAD